MFNIATALVATGFAMMLGGNLIDVTVTTVMGVWLALCIMVAKIKKINGLLLDIISCAGISFFTMCAQKFVVPGINLDVVIVSSLMPIVPGVAITNAIRDTLQGDYLSGCARVLEAFLKAASVAIGVGLGMALGGMVL